MSACVFFAQRGNLRLHPADALSPEDCPEFLLLDADTANDLISLLDFDGSVSDFELLGVTPEAILYVFTWGMGAVLMMWSLGYAIGAAVTALKKL